MATNKKVKKKKSLDNLSFFDKLQIVIAFFIIFFLLFLIMYRNSKMSESYAEINSIKTDISKVQKENSQLEVDIQSSLNLKNIEQSAKQLLGMQKLTNAQTIYINLPKKDYIETNIEDIMVEEEGIFDKVINKIKNFIK